MDPADANRRIYEDGGVVDYYARHAGLQAVEQYLFERYITPASRMLDIGIGGGRTTAYLNAVVADYVGIDYSAAMVAAAREKFPQLDIRHLDATNLAGLAADRFDAVVFSFNGIDYIPRDQDRAQCLREVWRVLKPQGIFIFSTHHARFLIETPQLATALPGKWLWRIGRAVTLTLVGTIRAVLSTSFWRGHGYKRDYIHGRGGLYTHVATPARVAKELASLGFSLVEYQGNLYPARAGFLRTNWYYYVARK